MGFFTFGAHEIDFFEENNTALWFNNLPTRGVYRAEDPDKLLLSGAIQDINTSYLNLTFASCIQR